MTLVLLKLESLFKSLLQETILTGHVLHNRAQFVNRLSIQNAKHYLNSCLGLREFLYYASQVKAQFDPVAKDSVRFKETTKAQILDPSPCSACVNVFRPTALFAEPFHDANTGKSWKVMACICIMKRSVELI